MTDTEIKQARSGENDGAKFLIRILAIAPRMQMAISFWNSISKAE